MAPAPPLSPKQHVQRLQDYLQRKGFAFSTPPVPIERIVTACFGLSIEASWSLPEDCSGQLFPEEKRIVLRHDLVDNRSTLGRKNFTLAHELGHWLMHQVVAGERPARLCRTSKVGQIEFEADEFAWRLLMPADAVLRYYHGLANEYSREAKLALTAEAFQVSVLSAEIALREFSQPRKRRW